MYSDIRPYCFSDTNIFKRTNLTCATKTQKLFTHRLIDKEKLFFLCCVNYVLTFIPNLKSNTTPNIKSKT